MVLGVVLKPHPLQVEEGLVTLQTSLSLRSTTVVQLAWFNYKVLTSVKHTETNLLLLWHDCGLSWQHSTSMSAL